MAEPIWVLEEVAIAIHKEQLAEHGGLPGIRDHRLLDSALNKPILVYQYADFNDPQRLIAAIAASYAIGIIKNHPFIDGNKRTGYILCALFLELNGYTITATKEVIYTTIIKLSGNAITLKQFEDWVFNNIEFRAGTTTNVN